MQIIISFKLVREMASSAISIEGSIERNYNIANNHTIGTLAGKRVRLRRRLRVMGQEELVTGSYSTS